MIIVSAMIHKITPRMIPMTIIDDCGESRFCAEIVLLLEYDGFAVGKNVGKYVGIDVFGYIGSFVGSMDG